MKIKCSIDICKHNKQGLCCLKEISIGKYYDGEYNVFSGGFCGNLEFKESYLIEKSERTYSLMKISDDTYYAVRTSCFDDIDVEYIFKKYPKMKTLITDNIVRQGSSKSDNRFWIFTVQDSEIKFSSVCNKFNKLITKEMLKFTCDYIRQNEGYYGCLTSTSYKMILKGINL